MSKSLTLFWEISFSFSLILSLQTIVVGQQSLGQSTNDTVNVGYIDIWPIAYTEGGMAMGDWNNTVRAALLDLKRPYSFREVPIKRMYSLVSQGVLDIAMTVRNSGYVEDTVLRGSLPVGNIQTRLFAIGPNAFDGFTNIFDIKNEGIIVVHGFSHAGLRAKLERDYPDIQLLETTTHESGLAMLKAGRAKYLLGYNRPASSNWAGIDLSTLHNQIVQEVPIYFVVSTKAQNHKELLEALEEKTRALKSGEKTRRAAAPD
ncbi:MAG: hypothetical protein JKY60_18200 [Kordiimonadaceae bacterium]|nr:hypothetical protein [Kordiimonadaceae bacterium]